MATVKPSVDLGKVLTAVEVERINAKVKRLDELSGMKNVIEGEIKALQAELAVYEFSNENNYIALDRQFGVRFNYSGGRIDTKKLEEDLPEVAKKYTSPKEFSSRVVQNIKEYKTKIEI